MKRLKPPLIFAVVYPVGEWVPSRTNLQVLPWSEFDSSKHKLWTTIDLPDPEDTE